MYIEKIKLLASELSDNSPKTQLEIVKLCKKICLLVSDAIEEEVNEKTIEVVNQALAEVNAKITALEVLTNTNTNQISANTANIEINANNINGLETLTAEHTTSIETNTNNINALETLTAQHTTSIETNTNDIDALKTLTAQHTTSIETLLTRLETLENNIPFEKIKDANNNLRFIEFNGRINRKITNSYGKASLSGTHLMFVLSGTIANGTVLNAGEELIYVTPASWIYNKINGVFENNSIIEVKTTHLYNNNGQIQNLDFALKKSSGNKINIISYSNLTLNDNRNFRVQFDLLIDNAA